MKFTKAQEKYIQKIAAEVVKNWTGATAQPPQAVIEDFVGCIGIDMVPEQDYVLTVRVTAEAMHGYTHLSSDPADTIAEMALNGYVDGVVTRVDH